MKDHITVSKIKVNIPYKEEAKALLETMSSYLSEYKEVNIKRLVIRTLTLTPTCLCTILNILKSGLTDGFTSSEFVTYFPVPLFIGMILSAVILVATRKTFDIMKVNEWTELCTRAEDKGLNDRDRYSLLVSSYHLCKIDKYYKIINVIMNGDISEAYISGDEFVIHYSTKFDPDAVVKYKIQYATHWREDTCEINVTESSIKIIGLEKYMVVPVIEY